MGELWLAGDRVVHSELPRPRPAGRPGRSTCGAGPGSDPGQTLVPAAPAHPRGRSTRGAGPGSDPGQTLARRLQAFFGGQPDDFADVELELPDGFHGDCAAALRHVPRGHVVTYGELAALAGRPRAARAAGTFCARCGLSPFLPTHRVVGAAGIGSYGSLGIEYKRRLLALEGVAL